MIDSGRRVGRLTRTCQSNVTTKRLMWAMFPQFHLDEGQPEHALLAAQRLSLTVGWRIAHCFLRAARIGNLAFLRL